LAIARSLVQAHGGSIQAASEGPGRGATFRLELPLIPQLASERVAAAAILPDAKAGFRRSLRILLLEDHEPTREALTQMLARRGHEVSAAATLLEARALAERRAFDLFISDLGLPDGDGTTLMRELAAAGGPPGIALSGYGMEQDIQRSLDGGFAAHLVKPVDVDLLDRTMARWVEP
jgi:CheY-like chemotaxis protein